MDGPYAYTRNSVGQMRTLDTIAVTGGPNVVDC